MNKNASKKRFLARRDGKFCALCNKPFINFSGISIDHIIPKSKGGENTIENMQLAHILCNTRKGNGEPQMSNLLKLKLQSTNNSEEEK